MKKLLLTFDHELFLGEKSGRPEDCMLRPAKRILAEMDAFACKGLFFVDATYLWHLHKQGAEHPFAAKDLKVLSQQIGDMVRAGHEIGLHLHPHWMDAEPLEGGREWSLRDKRYYRFHSLEEGQRRRLFEEAFALLDEVVRKADSRARVRSYRAGGWSLQPFSDFAPFFREKGILYEFSVRPGFFAYTDAQQYDFTPAPRKWSYRFSEKVCEEDPQGDFVEFPITSVAPSARAQQANRLRNRIAWKVLKERTFGKGIGAIPQALPSPPAAKGPLASPDQQMAAIELMTRFTLPAFVEQFEQGEGMQFISHPKMVTEHNLATFGKFLRRIHKKYDVQGDVKAILEEAKP